MLNVLRYDLIIITTLCNAIKLIHIVIMTDKVINNLFNLSIKQIIRINPESTETQISHFGLDSIKREKIVLLKPKLIYRVNSLCSMYESPQITYYRYVN